MCDMIFHMGKRVLLKKRFVLKEHHATRLHYDFRVERSGIAVSWAIPKGLSMNPSETRLAISVPDHPLSSLDFVGTRRKGLYGAGEVATWDRGQYTAFSINDMKILIILYGRKLRGAFLLQRKHLNSRDWFITKTNDEYADPKFVVKPILKPRKHKGFEPLLDDLDD